MIILLKYYFLNSDILIINIYCEQMGEPVIAPCKYYPKTYHHYSTRYFKLQHIGNINTNPMTISRNKCFD